MSIKTLCRLFMIVLLGMAHLGNAQGTSFFEKATEAYNKGEYATAIAQYEKILSSGEHSASVYYNLGNAHYKQNEIAESIYYYEKALLLAPNDPEILNNLSYAQQMTLDAINPLPETDFAAAYKTLTLTFHFDQWATIGVVLMLLFSLLYIFFYFSTRPRSKRFLFIGSLLALFLSLFAVTMAFMAYRDYESQQPAIIFADEIDILSEPNPNGSTVFQLHAGTKVNVLEQLKQWKKIRLADGKTGWVPAEALRQLKDF